MIASWLPHGSKTCKNDVLPMWESLRFKVIIMWLQKAKYNTPWKVYTKGIESDERCVRKTSKRICLHKNQNHHLQSDGLYIWDSKCPLP